MIALAASSSERQELLSNNKPVNGLRLSRRDMIRRLASGAGSGLLFAGVAKAHPIYKHLADGTLLAQANVDTATGTWTPLYLSRQQNETLIPLAECLVPNSTQAQVNRFIDLLLSVETAKTRKEFDESLHAIDQEAVRRFSRPFSSISAAEREELLTALSSGPSRHGARESAFSEEDAAPPKETENIPYSPRDHFDNLKSWVSGAYYSSEQGMRELGWTGMNFFQDFPGCQHPEGHS